MHLLEDHPLDSGQPGVLTVFLVCASDISMLDLKPIQGPSSAAVALGRLELLRDVAHTSRMGSMAWISMMCLYLPLILRGFAIWHRI